MLEVKSDRYLQYVFLMGEGSPLVLRALIHREESSAGKSIHDILQGNEHASHVLGKSLDSWLIGESSHVILHCLGHAITHQERLQIKSISYCRDELSHRSPQSFSEDELKRTTSDLVLSLMHLCVGTDQEAFDRYQQLLAESQRLDCRSIIARIRDCREFDDRFLDGIEKHGQPLLEQDKKEKVIQSDKLKDYLTSLRKLKESLTKAVLHGIDFDKHLVLDVLLEVQGPSDDMMTKATLILLNVFSETIGSVLKSSKQGKVRLSSEGISEAVRALVDILQSVDGLRIQEVLFGSVTLRLKCPSVLHLKKLLKTLESEEFESALDHIGQVLKHELGVSAVLKEEFVLASIKRVEDSLSKQGLGYGHYKDLSCRGRHAQPIVSYCHNHEVFCCHLCAVKDHRNCVDLMKTTENEEENVRVVDRKDYSIRVEEDQAVCWINGCCILPNGEILLTDENNRNLKKMNRDFMLVAHLDLPKVPYDVCHVGHEMAAVGLWGKGIQFVHNRDVLEMAHLIDLEHSVLGLVSDGTVIYVTDQKFVYAYRVDGKEKSVLYRSKAELVCFSKIALSDDHKKLYIIDGYGGLETIDTKGNHLHTFRADELKLSRGISVSGDGSVLACEYETDRVLRLDPDGKSVLATILSRDDGVSRPAALGLDRRHSKLVVGLRDKGFISVYELK